MFVFEELLRVPAMAEPESANAELASISTSEGDKTDKTLTADEEKRRERKMKKEEMKQAARARSKEKRKETKIAKRNQEKEASTKLEIEALNSTSIEFVPTAASNFDSERRAMIQQLSEIRTDKSRAGRVDEQILDFVGPFSFVLRTAPGRIVISDRFLNFNTRHCEWTEGRLHDFQLRGSNTRRLLLSRCQSEQKSEHCLDLYHT